VAGNSTQTKGRPVPLVWSDADCMMRLPFMCRAVGERRGCCSAPYAYTLSRSLPTASWLPARRPDAHRPPPSADTSASYAYVASSNATFVLNLTAVTAQAATTACADMGGYLVAYGTLAEQIEVEQYFWGLGILLQRCARAAVAWAQVPRPEAAGKLSLTWRAQVLLDGAQDRLLARVPLRKPGAPGQRCAALHCCHGFTFCQLPLQQTARPKPAPSLRVLRQHAPALLQAGCPTSTGAASTCLTAGLSPTTGRATSSAPAPTTPSATTARGPGRTSTASSRRPSSAGSSVSLPRAAPLLLHCTLLAHAVVTGAGG
jgi:hypothetical protein